MVIFHSYVSLPEGKFFRKNHGWWVSCKRLPESIHGLIDWKLDGNIPSKSLGWSMINISQTTLGLENMASGIRTHWLWTAWEPCKWGQLSWVKLSRSSASAPGLAWGGKTLSVWFVMICDDYDDDDMMMMWFPLIMIIVTDAWLMIIIHQSQMSQLWLWWYSYIFIWYL